MRIALLAAASVLLALTGGAGATPGGPPPIVAKSIYVVRPDPRECPSPLCGGYWVSLANRARTKCADGALRPRCYVAEVVDARTRQPTSIAGGSLAKGVLGSVESDFGQLGNLAAVASWAPVGRAPATGDFFRLRDTGIRCVRAPCFSIRVGRVNAGAHTSLVSSLDLGPARTGPARQKADDALEGADGLLVAGVVEATANGGRLFRASQVYLKAPPLHA
jgi:hypothetical protein